ncbi:class I SAM-dependent methyltransferase [Echinicola marina]|uniref:O-methyltransferase n=1 Tax=Echinicola marina TaxID=2859768 RepID=UPI001CF65294|nr:class I SAM-dependent methyltransferase [Echinicola marina]UCS91482.1 class I SAM-dependent methyltransferase [Echinicola marina]
MLKKLFPFFSYINYFLLKEDRHSLQAPFAYEVYEGLRSFSKGQKDIELIQLKNKLLTNHQEIFIEDFGAGSIHLKKKKLRKVADITRHSSSSDKYSRLYQYFCALTPAKTVIELGTCVGINTCYLSKATLGQLYTFEGSASLSYVAQNTFSSFDNIKLIEGKIQESLPPFLEDIAELDFVLIDAHHTYQATLHFFELIKTKLHTNSIVAIGDIHWSPEMQKAWEQIKTQEEVSMSMDFYECGILFFKKGINKKHYTLNY